MWVRPSRNTTETNCAGTLNATMEEEWNLHPFSTTPTECQSTLPPYIQADGIFDHSSPIYDMDVDEDSMNPINEECESLFQDIKRQQHEEGNRTPADMFDDYRTNDDNYDDGQPAGPPPPGTFVVDCTGQGDDDNDAAGTAHEDGHKDTKCTTLEKRKPPRPDYTISPAKGGRPNKSDKFLHSKEGNMVTHNNQTGVGIIQELYLIEHGHPAASAEYPSCSKWLVENIPVEQLQIWDPASSRQYLLPQRFAFSDEKGIRPRQKTAKAQRRNTNTYTQWRRSPQGGTLRQKLLHEA